MPARRWRDTAPGLPRPRGAAVSLLGALAVALLAGSAAAQTPGRAAELEVPDLTVTAEDPLTLLPPLGPAPDDSPIPLPPPDATRARHRESPPPPPSGSGAVPSPRAALQSARAPEALPRSSDLAGRVVLLDVAGLRALHAAVLLATAAPGSETALALAATAPLLGEGATRVAAHAGLDAVGWRFGLDLALAEAASGRLGQGRLAADGPVAATVTYASWRTGSLAALEALAGLESLPLPPALEVAVGGAVALDRGAVSVFPAGRVSFAPAAEWRLEAGVRPAIGFPAWLLDPAESVTDELELTPERAWLAWLGGGYGDLDLRLGMAHGLIHGFHDEGSLQMYETDLVGVVGTHAVLFLLALQWDTVARRGPPGDITLRVAAGAATTWTPGTGALSWPGSARPGGERDEPLTGTYGVVGRLLVEADWPILATPPVAVLARAGLLQAPVFGVEEWLAAGPAYLGLSAAAGLRWAPAHGHHLQFLAGIRGPSERDLTVFAGIEYARSVVRLVAPPVTAAR